MDATELVDKILSDAKAEAEKITSQAEVTAKVEKAELDKKLAEYKAQTDALASKAGLEKKSRMLAAARMQIAKELLAEKRQIMDGVFKQAKQKLKSLPDEDYQKLMQKLMLKAVETGDEEVIVDSVDNRIDHKFIKNINRELGPGFKGNLRLSDHKEPIGAGFILRRGNIMNNVSLDVLISQSRKDMEIKLAKELFGN
ncbi:MAG TPA: V-type ATP synthase subunit E [Sedimentisphaerales bacterium]|nr:V-type ATP synthase subunit E [Sedimentisphaerales bacterium]